MEEFVFILPVYKYGMVIFITAIIIAIIFLAILLRLLKVPQKLMAILICAISMMILFYYQPDGQNFISSYIAIAQRQKQLDEQFSKTSLSWDNIVLHKVKIRRKSITLSFFIQKKQLSDSAPDAMATFSKDFIRENKTQLCAIKNLEQKMSYRNTKNTLDFQISDFILEFTNEANNNKKIIVKEDCSKT